MSTEQEKRMVKAIEDRVKGYNIIKEKPILFSAPMVRAILEGRKTQTRRVVKKSITEPRGYPECTEAFKSIVGGLELLAKVHCPYGKVGDRLWVREKFKVLGASAAWECSSEAGLDFQEGFARVNYPADGVDIDYDDLVINDNGVDESEQAVSYSKKTGYNPSIFMPRWASRIDLLIKDVRVERLQDISEEGAAAEGCTEKRLYSGLYRTAYSFFCELWESIHGEDSWNENPWVWVVEFERIKP